MTDITEKSMKTFTVAGTSVLNGVCTFRFATGKASVRAGVLKRNGHTDIDLRELPNAMTKAEAQAFLEAAGIEAVVPVSGRKAAEVPPAKTPEELAAEAEAQAREKKNAERREKRRQAKAAETAEADAAFLSGMTDGSAESLIETPADVEVVEVVESPAVAEVGEVDEPTAESVLAALDEAGV